VPCFSRGLGPALKPASRPACIRPTGVRLGDALASLGEDNSLIANGLWDSVRLKRDHRLEGEIRRRRLI
jgi:hypothetical protein